MRTNGMRSQQTDPLSLLTLFCHLKRRNKANNKYILLTKREVKMAGYWPSSLFAFLWTETKKRFIIWHKEH